MFREQQQRLEAIDNERLDFAERGMKAEAANSAALDEHLRYVLKSEAALSSLKDDLFTLRKFRDDHRRDREAHERQVASLKEEQLTAAEADSVLGIIKLLHYDFYGDVQYSGIVKLRALSTKGTKE